jgi:hypothetical protein
MSGWPGRGAARAVAHWGGAQLAGERFVVPADRTTQAEQQRRDTIAGRRAGDTRPHRVDGAGRLESEHRVRGQRDRILEITGYARLSSSTGMVRTPAVWRSYSAKPG